MFLGISLNISILDVVEFSHSDSSSVNEIVRLRRYLLADGISKLAFGHCGIRARVVDDTAEQDAPGDTVLAADEARARAIPPWRRNFIPNGQDPDQSLDEARRIILASQIPNPDQAIPDPRQVCKTSTAPPQPVLAKPAHPVDLDPLSSEAEIEELLNSIIDEDSN